MPAGSMTVFRYSVIRFYLSREPIQTIFFRMITHPSAEFTLKQKLLKYLMPAIGCMPNNRSFSWMQFGSFFAKYPESDSNFLSKVEMPLRRQDTKLHKVENIRIFGFLNSGVFGSLWQKTGKVAIPI